MIKFLWKGVLRDRKRSLLPIIIIAIGVIFIVFLDGYVSGMLRNILETTASHQTGHVKVMTHEYWKSADQKPNDLAIYNSGELVSDLQKQFPLTDWCERIYFGALLDIPNQAGETKAQGPVSGNSFDFLSGKGKEQERLRLDKTISEGRAIEHSGEILLSNDFSKKHGVHPGDTLTLFGSTMYGSMSFSNFIVVGIVKFGTIALDKGAVIIDISDARQFLDMENATGEILGFMPNEYNLNNAEEIKNTFNANYVNNTDAYAPVMVQLADQNFLGDTITFFESTTYMMILLLIVALSIILWNTGIIGGLRRYNEFGVRIAMGEEKRHIYKTFIMESLLIALIGSSIGTIIGIGISYWLHISGIDYSEMMESVPYMVDPIIRPDVNLRMFFIGFIPGVISMLLGSALAGKAIFKRKTATLFKELD